MPKYDFYCGECSVVFEGFLIKFPENPTEVKMACPRCRSSSGRYFKPHSVGLTYKGGAPTPTIDQVVGSDADRRWATLEDRQKKANAVRRNTGSQHLEIGSEGFKPLSRDTAEVRTKAYEAYKKSFNENKKGKDNE